ncbi:uncharacterized protein [Clytia hemisphaerica]|uniref:uncharacterized protein n=1 Tax=Clytia hemisphaerica TaxID=252671 RepID=UPI0034D6CC13
MADGRDTRASMQSRSSSVKFITKDISMTGSRKSHSANTTSSGVTSGITRLRDKRFLKSAQNKGKEQPNIDDFDHEISVFKEAKEEVGRADIAHSIGWVRINMQPIKETIETYASKWLYTYTKYLSDQVKKGPADVEFTRLVLKRTEPGIEAILAKKVTLHPS